MTIQQIQYILEVYRTGSISRAAENLFVAQPNLSNAIRAVERDLGFPVFVRSGKGVQPTEKGMAVLSHAGQIMESYQKMQLIGRQTTAHRIRICGIQFTPICDAYVQLCTEYQDAPALDFSFNVDSTPEEAMDRIYLSMLDVALVLLHPQHVEDIAHQCAQKGLQMNKIADIPIVLRIGPRHPLYNAPEIRLSDFENYTFVDYNNRVFLDFPNLNSVLSINPERIVYISDHSVKNQLISQSTMYGVGCKMTASSNQRYRFRNIPLGDLHYTLFSMERENGPRSPVADRYLEILREMTETI